MKDLVDKISAMVNWVFWWEKIESTTIQPDHQSEIHAPVLHNTPQSHRELGDMTNLAGQYPNEARAKNNNPSGITRPMSKTLRAELEQSWIKFYMWSSRPANEWWHYVKFDTMDEGLKAKKIVLIKWNMVIRERLAKRVGTKNTKSNYEYADKIIASANIDWSKRFNDLTDDELDRLMMMQIRQESGGLYKELVARNVAQIEDNIA